jgi:hypothetical protein
MPRKSKEQRLNEVHQRAMAEWNRIQAAQRDERMQCLQDRRFYSIAGAQWEGPLAEQFDNKPRFEVNKTHLAVIRIFNEYRNNRITVDFQPRDGEDADDLADTCDSLFRADMADSCGEEAVDNAFEEGVGGGFGAFRLRACYEDEEDEENDRQRIAFEPIFDADSCVFFDLDAKRQDKSDATRCYVLHSRDRQSYVDDFGDDPGQWPKEVTQQEFDWATPDLVYFCEYYEIEHETEIVHRFKGLDGQEMLVPQSELEDDAEEDADDEPTEERLPGKLETLIATGFKKVGQKRLTRKRVHKYLLGAHKVLEDEGYIAGSCIPVIPFYGKRWFIDGVERCMGHVRLAKDAQRLANMERSKLGEITALSSVGKPILTPQQISGHAVMWEEDNVKNYPYLLLNPVTDLDGNPMPAGPMAYTQPPQVPPALAALLQVTEQDLQDLLGNAQAGEKMVSNIAEKTVELIQQRLDMQTFIYISNMAKSLRRAGEVWLSMAKELYVEEGRKMRALSTDGQVSSVELLRPIVDEQTGEQRMENDLKRAKYGVTVEVGPASSSRRSALVRSLTALLQLVQDPEERRVLVAQIMTNLEGEGMQDTRKWFRTRLVRMGVIKPTEEELAAMAAEAEGQGPDPQAQLMAAMGEEAVAKAAKARADTIDTIAAAEKKRAETTEILAGVDRMELQNALDVTAAIREANTQPAAAQAGLPA